MTHVFGIPGEENIHLVEALSRSPIRYVLVRHEQAASFMAETYGRLTGRAGVCSATLGPGAINLLLGVADATTNSTPVVALSAQVGMYRSYKESHQGVDLVSMFDPVTKWSALMATPGAAPEMIRKAFKLAQTERPGAVYLAVPEDVEKAPAPGDARPLPVNIPRSDEPSREQVSRAAAILDDGGQPGGAGRSRRHPGRCRPRPPPVRREAGGIGGHHLPRQGGVPRRPSPGARGHRVHASRLRQLRLRPGRRGGDRRLRAPGVRPGADQSGRGQGDHPHPPVSGRGGPALQRVGGSAGRHRGQSRRPGRGGRPALRFGCRRVEHPRAAGRRSWSRGRTDARFPLAPARIVADTRAALGRHDIVLVDTGALKMWMARLYPHLCPQHLPDLQRPVHHGLDGARSHRRQDRPA